MRNFAKNFSAAFRSALPYQSVEYFSPPCRDIRLSRLPCRVAMTTQAIYNARMATKRHSQKLSKNIIIAIVAIVLIIAITMVILYFAAPETFDAIAAFFKPEGSSSTGGGGNTETPPLERGEGDLQVHFIDVGQGDCILILFPDGKDMLIDCGNKSSGYSFDETAEYLDTYITDDTLDYIMLTHGDEDHVEYLDNILEMYQVNNIFMPNILAAPNGTGASSVELREQIDAIDDEKIAMFTDPDVLTSNMYAEFFVAAFNEPDCNVMLNIDPSSTENSIVITDEANTYRLAFYCPTQEYYNESNLNSAEKKNAVSPIGILEYNGFRIVLTGDSNEINEPLFVDRIGGELDCDVLKVGHHGSETSSTEEFLNAIDCEYAVISCKADGNTFYHPRQATLDRFVERDMTIYRTDNNGNIVLTVNESITFSLETEVDQSVNRVGLTGAGE